MKALVGAFNQEKALVGAFSVIVQPVVEPMDHYTALLATHDPNPDFEVISPIMLLRAVQCEVEPRPDMKSATQTKPR